MGASQTADLEEQARAGLRQLLRDVRRVHPEPSIAKGVTFIQWVEDLAAKGLKVDGHAFSLDDRAALRFLYEVMPSEREDAHRMTYAVMKGAQVGMTVWEMLYSIFIALKWEPVSVGMYVPDRSLAAYKSAYRFMPVLRTVPDAYKKLVAVDERTGKSKGEGNVLTRVIGASNLLFLWTSGKVSTESYPMDVVTFDEVQGMDIGAMERTSERMSASDIRLRLMLSTAMDPDGDIHYWYKLGCQYRFHNFCDCEDGVILDEEFPQCVQYNEGQWTDAPLHEYIYVCPHCNAWIRDNQAGEWRIHNEAAQPHMVSLHVPQTISATVTARDIIESYFNAEDLANFWQRKLGRPYTDPSQVPVTLEMLKRCARLGQRLGVEWKGRAKGAYMGIDQMGAFNVVLIKERRPDGRQALIHAELIYDDDPFVRCDVLMRQYGIAVCVVETLPNYNDAHRFANRHPGKVFLAGYKQMEDGMMRWGDARLTRSERKTDENSRERYRVTLDQYKCMASSLARFKDQFCLFPDPDGLRQVIQEKNARKRVAVLRDVVWYHLTRVALISERDPEQKKFKRRVVKVGIDPHFAYANMLVDVAWARAHGTSSFVLADGDTAMPKTAQERVRQAMPGLNDGVVRMIDDAAEDTCGRCAHFDRKSGQCAERKFRVHARDPACPLFELADDLRGA